MGIPGSKLNTVIDVQAIAALMPNLYPDRADFLRKSTTRDSANQEVHTFAPWPIPNPIANLPCRLSPIILIRPEKQIEQTTQQESINGKFHLDLTTNPTDVEIGWQVTVRRIDPGGVDRLFQIFGVESDGNSLTARYLVGEVVPFNA